MIDLLRLKQVMFILAAAMTCTVSVSIEAGQVVVRKSSEAFDAFAVRDQVLREHEWREALRMQQQINILQSLPVGCIPMVRPYAYFSCGGNFYRPYQYQNKELYIQIDPLDSESPSLHK